MRLEDEAAREYMRNSKWFNTDHDIRQATCHCGCGRLVIETTQIDRMDAFRELIGRPVRINCMYRCKEHNTRVRGSSNSAHLRGEATDISLTRPVLHDRHTFWSAMLQVWPRRRKFYRNFAHVDDDPTLVAWTPEYRDR